VWNKIKNWFRTVWQKCKAWVGKNKAWLIAVGASFISGIAVAFSVSAKRNARVDKYIAELEDRLSTYAELNKRLGTINTEFATRLAGLERNNEDLRWQNAELGKVIAKASSDIEFAMGDIERAKQAIDSGISTTEQLSELGKRIQNQSTAVGQGIERLANFIEKYGAQN